MFEDSRTTTTTLSPPKPIVATTPPLKVVLFRGKLQQTIVVKVPLRADAQNSWDYSLSELLKLLPIGWSVDCLYPAEKHRRHEWKPLNNWS